MAKEKNKRSIGHVKRLDTNKYLLRLSLGFDDFGKRIQPSKVVECTSDREAEKLLLAFYNDRERLKMQHTSFTPKTLGQLYDDWTIHHVANLRPRTSEFYKELWNKNVKYAENLKLENISAAHIRKIIDSANGDRTKNAVYKMLNAIFNKAVKWGYIQSNPCQRIDAPRYTVPEKKVLSESQILLACEKVKEEETKYQAIFYLAIICSMRREEIVGLSWTSDIDFERDEIHINTAAVNLSGKGTILDDTKTEKSKRTLHMPDIIKRILLTLRNEQNVLKEVYGDKWTDNDYVFTQQNGKLMNIHTPTNWWREFSNKHGIFDITLHGLRHTAATHMIKNNVPISTVSGVLGHSNITTTLNTYTHVIEDTKKAAINIMADIVSSTGRELDRQII